MRTSFGCLALVLCCQFANATPISTLTFDELPFQSVDGLFFRGVTFDFKIDGADSAEAFYASFGPGSLSTVTDPSLTGDASGELTLEFTRPTGLLEFGVALSTGSPLMPGLEVELFDASGGSLALLSVDTVLVVDNLGFSEAQFAYSGTPVATAVIDFADGPGSFALDNLTYQIPEPSTLALSAVVFGLFTASRRNRSRPLASAGLSACRSIRTVVRRRNARPRHATCRNRPPSAGVKRAFLIDGRGDLARGSRPQAAPDAAPRAAPGSCRQQSCTDGW